MTLMVGSNDNSGWCLYTRLSQWEWSMCGGGDDWRWWVMVAAVMVVVLVAARGGWPRMGRLEKVTYEQ